VPPREVRAGDVADLAARDEVVERTYGLFHRRVLVEAVHVVQVDVVGAEAAEAVLAGAHEEMPRRANIVRRRAHREGRLGRDQQITAAAGDRRPEDLLGSPARIGIRGVEERRAGVDTDVHQPLRLGHIRAAPRSVELAAAAERRRSEAQHRHAQPAPAQLPEFHIPPACQGLQRSSPRPIPVRPPDATTYTSWTNATVACVMYITIMGRPLPP
jgi:hypothetical protein